VSERPDERSRPPDEEPEEGRAQQPQLENEPQPAGEPPADPDRPTDEVRRGNTLVEPAPGD